MKILALEKELPEATPEQFQQLTKEEALRVWELYQQGIVREMYFREDRSEAVLMLECDDEEEAEAVLQTLPLVGAGLITFELIPLAAYPGFARLFSI
jgi:muconolactone delta-isomerase